MSETDSKNAVDAAYAVASAGAADSASVGVASAAGAADVDAQSAKAPKKKGPRKLPIVIGTAAVVVAVAGAGFWTWHEQPSFCGATCHTLMDAYLTTYETGNVDKYGNDVDDQGKTAMMSYLHKNVADATCLSCHTPVLTEQVTEGMNWATGNYYVMGQNKTGDTILQSRSLKDLTEATGTSSEEFCLRSGCHVNADGSVMTRDDLVQATAGLSETRNPHLSQHGDIDCGQCHKAHSQSVNYCSDCHDDAPIPDGWLTADEAKATETID